MQIIRVDVISNAVKHLQARYQFESAQVINRWLTMKLVNAIIAGKEDLSEILDEIIPSLPATHALAGKDEPKDFDDLREDIRRACETLNDKLAYYMDNLSMDIDDLAINHDSPEVWIAYHEIDDDTFAISVRDKDSGQVNLLPVIDGVTFPQSDVVHVIDGAIVLHDRIITPDGEVIPRTGEEPI